MKSAIINYISVGCRDKEKQSVTLSLLFCCIYPAKAFLLPLLVILSGLYNSLHEWHFQQQAFPFQCAAGIIKDFFHRSAQNHPFAAVDKSIGF